MLSSKRSEIKCWGVCGKKEPLDAAGGNVNWSTQYGKHDDGSSKIRLPHDPAIPLLDIY